MIGKFKSVNEVAGVARLQDIPADNLDSHKKR